MLQCYWIGELQATPAVMVAVVVDAAAEGLFRLSVTVNETVKVPVVA